MTDSEKYLINDTLTCHVTVNFPSQPMRRNHLKPANLGSSLAVFSNTSQLQSTKIV